jgi:hypothetical protein
LAIYVKNNKDFDSKVEGNDEPPSVLAAELVRIEHDREHFPYGYLPERLQRLLREAFACYSADLYLAFTIVCRRAIEASAGGSADAHATPFEALFDDAAGLSGIDAATRTALHTALFDQGDEPEIDADRAGVLIELVKDMLHQRYVRGAKLRRAIEMRRFFAHELQSEQAET